MDKAQEILTAASSTISNRHHKQIRKMTAAAITLKYIFQYLFCVLLFTIIDTMVKVLDNQDKYV